MNVFTETALINAYVAGNTIAEACRTAGVTASTGRRLLIKRGIARKAQIEPSICADMFVAGATTKAIAEKTGFSSTTVITALKRAGVFEPYRNVVGFTTKKSGYIVYTSGEHSGRGVHTVKMEERIGRRLLPDEVVHHIDGDRINNDINNLALCTRAAHTRLHRLQEILNGKERQRQKNGRYI